MPTTQFDYLIVGQGLAGSILAHSLITLGCKVMVIDNSHVGSSSEVAAGIINPITGPRLKKNDDFDAYYTHAKSYYTKLEYHIKETVFTPITQIRQIQTNDQSSFLEKRLADPDYHSIIQSLDDKPSSLLKQKTHPQIAINGTAIVNTSALLNACKKWLASLHSYQEAKFDYADLTIKPEHIEYQGLSAKKVVFCEGYQALNNPWLSHLPFKLAKGEMLTIKNNPTQTTMLSWDKWFVPQGETAKLGSNFAWDDLNLTPSDDVKNTLISSLSDNTNITPDVLSHSVGIRPSTRQREPFIGPLSTLDNAYCFNGFGSKGCLLMPFYASLLSNHLQQHTTLPSKVTKWL